MAPSQGFKLLGTDMTKDHTAVEAGLVPRFVRLKAHDYVGRDALREQKAYVGPLPPPPLHGSAVVSPSRDCCVTAA